MTTGRLGQDDREREDDFITRTMPLPAIDIAGYEPPAQVDYERPAAKAPADQVGAERGSADQAVPT